MSGEQARIHTCPTNASQHPGWIDAKKKRCTKIEMEEERAQQLVAREKSERERIELLKKIASLEDAIAMMDQNARTGTNTRLKKNPHTVTGKGTGRRVDKANVLTPTLAPKSALISTNTVSTSRKGLTLDSDLNMDQDEHGVLAPSAATGGPLPESVDGEGLTDETDGPAVEIQPEQEPEDPSQDKLKKRTHRTERWDEVSTYRKVSEEDKTKGEKVRQTLIFP
jgi:hypothetical protein